MHHHSDESVLLRVQVPPVSSAGCTGHCCSLLPVCAGSPGSEEEQATLPTQRGLLLDLAVLDTDLGTLRNR